jgi:hypothetical protein
VAPLKGSKSMLLATIAAMAPELFVRPEGIEPEDWQAYTPSYRQAISRAEEKRARRRQRNLRAGK